MRKLLIIIFALFCASCGGDDSEKGKASCTVPYHLCGYSSNGYFVPKAIDLSEMYIIPPPSGEALNRLMPDLEQAIQQRVGDLYPIPWIYPLPVTQGCEAGDWRLWQELDFNCADYE